MKKITMVPLVLSLMGILGITTTITTTTIIPTPVMAQGSDCSPPMYDYPEPGFILERCSGSDIVTTPDGKRVYVNEQTCTIQTNRLARYMKKILDLESTSQDATNKIKNPILSSFYSIILSIYLIPFLTYELVLYNYKHRQ
jgi:hypothetical protein